MEPDVFHSLISKMAFARERDTTRGLRSKLVDMRKQENYTSATGIGAIFTAAAVGELLGNIAGRGNARTKKSYPHPSFLKHPYIAEHGLSSAGAISRHQEADQARRVSGTGCIYIARDDQLLVDVKAELRACCHN